MKESVLSPFQDFGDTAIVMRTEKMKGKYMKGDA